MREQWRAKPINWHPIDVAAFGDHVREGMAAVRTIAEWQAVVRDASVQRGSFPERGERERPGEEEKAAGRAAQLSSGLIRWEHLQRVWRLRRARRRERAQAVVRATLEHLERGGWGTRGLPEAWGTWGGRGPARARRLHEGSGRDGGSTDGAVWRLVC